MLAFDINLAKTDEDEILVIVTQSCILSFKGSVLEMNLLYVNNFELRMTVPESISDNYSLNSS